MQLNLWSLVVDTHAIFKYPKLNCIMDYHLHIVILYLTVALIVLNTSCTCRSSYIQNYGTCKCAYGLNIFFISQRTYSYPWYPFITCFDSSIKINNEKS